MKTIATIQAPPDPATLCNPMHRKIAGNIISQKYRKALVLARRAMVHARPNTSWEWKLPELEALLNLARKHVKHAQQAFWRSACLLLAEQERTLECPVALIMLAENYFQLWETEKAIDLSRRVTKKHAKEWLGWFQRACFLASISQFKDALECCKKALACASSRSLGLQLSEYCVKLLCDLRRYTEALEWVNLILKECPTSPRLDAWRKHIKSEVLMHRHLARRPVRSIPAIPLLAYFFRGYPDAEYVCCPQFARDAHSVLLSLLPIEHVCLWVESHADTKVSTKSLSHLLVKTHGFCSNWPKRLRKAHWGHMGMCKMRTTDQCARAGVVRLLGRKHLLLALRTYEVVVRVVRELFQSGISYFPIFDTMSEACFYLGDFRAAQEWIELALSKRNKDCSLWYDKAVTLYRFGLKAQARRALQTALRLGKDCRRCSQRCTMFITTRLKTRE